MLLTEVHGVWVDSLRVFQETDDSTLSNTSENSIVACVLIIKAVDWCDAA